MCDAQPRDALRAPIESALSRDPHEPLEAETLAAWRPVLARVSALFAGEDELLLPGLAEDPRAALRALATERLRFVALKRGRRGGLLYDAHSASFLEWPAVPRLSGDPTGAGDAFAGGFLAAIVRGGTVQEALDQAMISASFALEDWGARGLMAATREEAERRMREWLGSGSRRMS